MRVALLSLAAAAALLVLSIAPSSSASAPEWEELGDMPMGLTLATCVELLDGRVLVTLGGKGEVIPSDLTWIYNQETDEWTERADAPAPFLAAEGVAMPDGKVYVFGGLWMDQDTMTLVRQTEVLIYDVEDDAWTTGAAVPGQLSLTEVAALDDERVLLAGGMDADMQATDACLIYDTVSGAFEAAAPLPAPRTTGVAFAYQGDAYYAGGSDAASLMAMPEVFRYDVPSGTWSLYGKMPEGRYYDEGAMGDDGLLYLYGGKTGATTDLTGAGTFRIVDMRDCSFVNAPEPPRAVIGAGVVATEDGHLLLLGGGVGMDPVANVSSLRIFQREAWLGNGECSPGEGVRVYADLQATFFEPGSYSMEVLLLKNGTVLATERLSAEKDESASVYLQVPEDLESGTYGVELRNVELDGRECDISFNEMSLNVTEAPSPTDRIADLEEQLAEMREDMMSATIGYAVLVLAAASLAIGVVLLVRRR